jgi:hypothetical protein
MAVDSTAPAETTKSTTAEENAESQTLSELISNPTAVGGNLSASYNAARIPHSMPKIKIQLDNTKPGPASSKPGLTKKPPKGSVDPIKLFNRFCSLDDMDLEVNLSPERGSSGQRKS